MVGHFGLPSDLQRVPFAEKQPKLDPLGIFLGLQAGWDSKGVEWFDFAKALPFVPFEVLGIQTRRFQVRSVVLQCPFSSRGKGQRLTLPG